MLADGGSLQFLRIIEYRQVTGELFVSVHFEQNIQRLQLLCCDKGILCVWGLIR